MTPSSSKTLPSTGLSLSLPHSSKCTTISCLCIISKYPAMSSKIVFLMFSHKTFIFRFLLRGSVLVPWGWKKQNRLHEATSHYGESIKDIINEELGDGIMSAIGFYCSVEKVKGKEGEDRVVITMNGKYLPHTEQKAADNVAKLAK
jgi:hypothetical protein